MHTDALRPEGVIANRTSQTLVRGLWIIVALVALVLTILSIPAQFRLAGTISDVEGQLTDWTAIPVDVLLSVERPFDIIYSLVTLGSAFACQGLALLLFLRQFKERTAVLTSFFLILYGVAMAGPLETLAATYSPELMSAVFKAQGLLWLLGGVTLFFIFPNGEFVPRWTRWAIVALILWSLLILFVPSLDPVAVDMSDLGAVWFLVGWFLAPSAFAVYAQIYRYRRHASAMQRLQIRWVASGFIGWMTAGTVISGVMLSVISALAANRTTFGPGFLLLLIVTRLIWPIGLILPPITLSVAVLRYRLYDIDLIIHRTFVFTVLSGMLGLVYVGSVLLFQQAFQSIIGQHSPLAIVTSTLLIVVLFAPLRRRVQNFIDRRFYRQKYNAQHTIDAFSDAIRDEVDTDHLTAELLHAVETTLQPEHVALWLRDPRG